jgi:hypothetical protein
MKKIETWLNEAEYKRFIEKARRKGKTPYLFLKEIVLKELETSN